MAEHKSDIEKTIDTEHSRGPVDAGLAAAFAPKAAVVIAEAGHSVLKLLGQHMALRDEEQDPEAAVASSPPSGQDSRYQLQGHQAVVRYLAFSADGRWLVSSGDDNTVRRSDLTLDSLLEDAQQLVGRRLTEGERRTYLGE